MLGVPLLTGARSTGNSAHIVEGEFLVREFPGQMGDAQQWQLSDGRAYAAIRNRQLLTGGVASTGHEVGRGTLSLSDLVNNRRLELGFYEFGSGIFTAGGGGEPFELWVHSGVVSIRGNSKPPPISHRFEVRQPDDAPGLNLESGYKHGNAAMPWGAFIYDAFDPPRPLYFQAQDGTGICLTPGGTTYVGGRLMAASAKQVLRLQAGSPTTPSSLTFGFWQPSAGGFDASLWRLEMRPGGGIIGLFRDEPGQKVSKGIYLTNDGRTGIGIDQPLARFQISANEPLIPTQIVKGATNQQGNLTEWQDAGGALLGRIDRSGYTIIRKTVAPAVDGLSNGEMVFHLDASPGACRLMVTARDSSGTLRTGSIGLE